MPIILLLSVENLYVRSLITIYKEHDWYTIKRQILITFALITLQAFCNESHSISRKQRDLSFLYHRHLKLSITYNLSTLGNLLPSKLDAVSCSFYCLGNNQLLEWSLFFLSYWLTIDDQLKLIISWRIENFFLSLYNSELLFTEYAFVMPRYEWLQCGGHINSCHVLIITR